MLDTSVVAGPGHFQLNMGVDGGSYGMTFSDPKFASSPPLMRLHGPHGGVAVRQIQMGVGIDYVKLDRSISGILGKLAKETFPIQGGRGGEPVESALPRCPMASLVP